MSKEKTYTATEVGEMFADILYALSNASADSRTDGGGEPFDFHTASKKVFKVAMENDIEIPEP